jgi:HSP20 family protein
MLVKADLPGVDPKDIEITLQNGDLLLRGEKKEQRDEKGKNFCRCERFCGSFSRTIPLPADADESGVTATSSKGVITVTIPKKPGDQTKKIPVHAKD